MAKKKMNRDLTFLKVLGKLIMGLSLAQIAMMFLRYPQMVALMEFFEDVGRVSSAVEGTRSYIMGEVALIMTGLGLGEFIRTRKQRIGYLLLSTTLFFFVWQVYRVVSDLYIYTAIAGY